ncbi:unnamed protein product, partial [Tetraodon nigroviridis]
PSVSPQKCLRFDPAATVWSAKQRVLCSLSRSLKGALNYGLFQPPGPGGQGRFLEEERLLREYPQPISRGVPALEFRYKSRVYKQPPLEEKQICKLHTKETCARVLLARGADKEVKNFNGQSPSQVAIIAGNFELAELIKKHKDSDIGEFCSRLQPRPDRPRGRHLGRPLRCRDGSKVTMENLHDQHGRSITDTPQGFDLRSQWSCDPSAPSSDWLELPGPLEL